MDPSQVILTVLLGAILLAVVDKRKVSMTPNFFQDINRLAVAAEKANEIQAAIQADLDFLVAAAKQFLPPEISKIVLVHNPADPPAPPA